MSEWIETSAQLPYDGELVEVRLPGGRKVKPVEFAAGRFWKYREGFGGHTYEPEAWRALVSKPREGGGHGGRAASTESTD